MAKYTYTVRACKHRKRIKRNFLDGDKFKAAVDFNSFLLFIFFFPTPPPRVSVVAQQPEMIKQRPTLRPRVSFTDTTTFMCLKIGTIGS